MMIGFKSGVPGFVRRLPVHDGCRNSDGKRIGRYVAQHHGISAYLGVVAHHDAPNDLGTRPDEHVVTNNRALRHCKIHVGLTGAQGYTLQDGAVFANAFRTYDGSHSVRQEQATADLHLRRNLNAEDKYIQHGEQFRERAKTMRVKELRKAKQYNRRHARTQAAKEQSRDGHGPHMASQAVITLYIQLQFFHGTTFLQARSAAPAALRPATMLNHLAGPELAHCGPDRAKAK